MRKSITNGRRTAILAICAAIVVGGSIAGASSAVGAGQADPPTLSSRGVAVSPDILTASDRAGLADLGVADGRLGRVSVQSGNAFYRIDKHGRPPCYTSGSTGGDEIFGIVACTSSFPGGESPILDQSVMNFSFDTRTVHVRKFRGWAVDGVGRVALVDEAGSEYSASVISNTYSLDDSKLPDVAFTAIVVYDSEGRKIFGHSLNQ